MVLGFGFIVSGFCLRILSFSVSGFKIQSIEYGLDFRVYSLGFRVEGLGFGVWSSEFGV